MQIINISCLQNGSDTGGENYEDLTSHQERERDKKLECSSFKVSYPTELEKSFELKFYG